MMIPHRCMEQAHNPSNCTLRSVAGATVSSPLGHAVARVGHAALLHNGTGQARPLWLVVPCASAPRPPGFDRPQADIHAIDHGLDRVGPSVRNLRGDGEGELRRATGFPGHNPFRIQFVPTWRYLRRGWKRERDVDRRAGRSGYPPGHFNRIVERAVADLGGIKSLYSSSFYPERDFHRIYGGDAFRELKEAYDPQGALGGLYEKCVGAR